MSLFEKVIEDTYDDDVRVYTEDDDDAGNVYLESIGPATDWSFTPAQARRLAKALKKAAKRAEGR